MRKRMKLERREEEMGERKLLGKREGRVKGKKRTVKRKVKLLLL